MFDAGCNDCSWAILLAAQINYCGADVNPGFIAMAKQHYPDLNVQCIDIRIEPLLPADCMMVRDVSIHFTNKEKTQLLQNFKKSKLQWLLITHIPSCNENLDLPETLDIVTADVNWTLPPWNFPQPIDTIDELYHGGRCLALWHRDQIESLI